VLQIVELIEYINVKKIRRKIKRNLVLYYIFKNTLSLKLVVQKFLCGAKKV
jgi:hypothetical protein